MQYSVLILTYNEEINIARCLESLSNCRDIVILDSHSTDNTLVIASQFDNVRIVQRPFDNYSRQRTYGLNEITYENDWLLMLDADETITTDLNDEIFRYISLVNSDVTLFRMRRKDHFMGKWIKRSSGYPTWFGRLMKIGHVRIEREINEEYHTDGEVAYLDHHIFHYPFNKGIAAWFDKHNRYSSMEANEFHNNDVYSFSMSALFNRDPVVRRAELKGLIYHLPFRPVVVFLSLYIVRRGFLDGSAGLRFCTLRAIYEYMIDCKKEELHLRDKNLPL